nr:ABC transporter permease [Streptococcus mutans]
DIIILGNNATNGGAIILAGSIPTDFIDVVSDLILGNIQRYLLAKRISTNQ